MEKMRIKQREKDGTGKSLMRDDQFHILLYSRLADRFQSAFTYPLFDGYFSGLPHELAHRNDASHAHSAHEYDENSSHVGQTQFVCGGTGFGRFILSTRETSVNILNCEVFNLPYPARTSSSFLLPPTGFENVQLALLLEFQDRSTDCSAKRRICNDT